MKENQRLLLLDSLRGVAALIVVFHHVFVFHPDWFAQTLGKESALFRLSAFISDLNHGAVMFFFVLSGFVIRLSTKKLNLFERKDLNFYLYKRFRRILPLYWITLAFTLLLGLAHGHHRLEDSYGPLTLLGNLFFLQTSDKVGAHWVEPYGENGPLWSLAYEMFFYLFFPLFMYALTRVGALARRVVAPEAALVASFLLGVAAIGLRQWFFMPFLSFLALFPVWMAGYYLGVLYVERRRPDRAILLFSAGAVLLWALTRWYPSDTLAILAKSWLTIVAPGYLMYRFKKRLAPLLAPLQRGLNYLFLQIGEGSYAIYLMHYPLLLLFQSIPGLPFPLRVLLLAIWCLFAARLEVVVNQRPFYSFKRNYV